MTENEPKPAEQHTYRHLPLLTWLLLVAVTAFFVKTYLKRPDETERKGVASVQRAGDVIRRNFYKKVDEGSLYRSAVKGMVDGLDDRFTIYLSPSEFRNMEYEVRGEFGGIGVIVRPDKTGTVIVRVQDGGAAAEAGLKPGDIIFKVDDQDCKGLKFDEVIALVRGPIGKSLTLSVRRNGEAQPLEFKLTRRKIEFPFIEWKIVEPGIGYLRLLQFDRDCDAKFQKGIEELLAKGMSVLVLDLRDDVGGLLPNCVNICDLFIKRGVIVSIEGRAASENKTFNATDRQVVPAGLPIFCLVNAHTASAAEILTGFLKDYGLATVIGTRTFGKGAVNRSYPLPDGAAIMLTVAHYATPKGIKINGKGITPDKIVGEVPPWDGGKNMKAQDWIKLVEKGAKAQYDEALALARAALKKTQGDKASAGEKAK